jgi:rod shape-determining protein MreD
VTAVRWAGLAALVVAATVAQAVVFPYVAVEGVVPNLALVVVVVAAFSRGPEFAAVLGFCAGLLLDLAPPADHVAGRWALALVLVGYLAGRVRRDARSSTVTAVLVVGACSFVGTSVYALSGLVLQDAAPDAGSMIQVIAISVLWDLLLAPLLVPALLRVFDRLRPQRIESRIGH